MKKITKTIGALMLGASILTMPAMTASAAEDRPYTYNYDWWEDVQDSPDAYSVCGVFAAADLGLETNFVRPEGLYVKGNMIYVCDTGNNRIVEIERVNKDDLEVRRIIDSFKGDVEVNTFSGPTDIAISEEGEFFIADKGNGRILKLDSELRYLMQFNVPVDSSLSADMTFLPSKIVIDTAGRVYCVAVGINKGLVKYEADGTFSGFVGATPVTFNFVDYIWKKLASQEQRARMEAFVPTEYDNVYIDDEGFIYTVTDNVFLNDQWGNASRDEDVDPVRKLNLMGSDILVRNGNYPVYGDLYDGGLSITGPSLFKDVTVLDNDIYICLDSNRGRLFGYDDQGRLVYAFGSAGNMNGFFQQPLAIEHMGYDLIVLDAMDCSLTLFTPTEFGALIYQAINQFNDGDYEASGESWQQVMNINGNYDLAYIGIGRSLLRQERYREAMDYFELKYDGDNYSKAYKQYRKQWVEEHILIIIIVLLVIFLVPLSIGRIRSIKHEIDIADIFRT